MAAVLVSTTTQQLSIGIPTRKHAGTHGRHDAGQRASCSILRASTQYILLVPSAQLAAQPREGLSEFHERGRVNVRKHVLRVQDALVDFACVLRVSMHMMQSKPWRACT